MVAVKAAEAERFLAKPPAGLFLYLVFGSDAGLVAERAHAIAARAVDDVKDPFQITRIMGDDLAGDPLRLADEANAVPMFGGRKAILIQAQGRAFLAALEPLFQAPPRDCTIIVEAGALRRDAPLRKMCETQKAAASVECEPDTAQDIAALIEADLRAVGLSIEAEAKTMLVSLLGQDRLTTRSEIAKLALYAHGDGVVETRHVEAIVADASGIALDAAINGAFEGDYAAVEETALRVFSEGGDPNALLGAALRHAHLLHRAKLDSEAGAGGWKPPSVDKHMRTWTAARAARAIATLGDAVARVRREPRIGAITAVRALWAVALVARSRAG